jgi:hypothetical protein
VLSAGSAPLKRCLEPIVAPEQLLAHDKSRRAEDAKLDGTLGVAASPSSLAL